MEPWNVFSDRKSQLFEKIASELAAANRGQLR